MSNKKNIAKDYLDKLSNGQWNEIAPIFGNNINTFLKFLKRNELLSEIDISSLYINDEFMVNPVMGLMLLNDSSYLNKIVNQFLNDVEIKSDGYYLVVSDLSNLSMFFTDSWREDSRSYVDSAFNDEYWDVYENESNDFYRDVIMNLNETNITYLSEKIINEIGNQELSLGDYYSPFFEEISNNGIFIITESNIRDVIEDQESMESLFRDRFYKLEKSFYNLYDVAYNEAYKDKLREETFKELSLYLDTKNLDNESPAYDELTLIKIKDLYSDVIGFLSRPSSYTLIDYNTYLHMMDNYLRKSDKFLHLDSNVDPDDLNVIDNINDEFLNYLNP